MAVTHWDVNVDLRCLPIIALSAVAFNFQARYARYHLFLHHPSVCGYEIFSRAKTSISSVFDLVRQILLLEIKNIPRPFATVASSGVASRIAHATYLGVGTILFIDTSASRGATIDENGWGQVRSVGIVIWKRVNLSSEKLSAYFMLLNTLLHFSKCYFFWRHHPHESHLEIDITDRRHLSRTGSSNNIGVPFRRMIWRTVRSHTKEAKGRHDLLISVLLENGFCVKNAGIKSNAQVV